MNPLLWALFESQGGGILVLLEMIERKAGYASTYYFKNIIYRFIQEALLRASDICHPRWLLEERKKKKSTKGMRLQSTGLKQTFLKIICVEKERWLCTSFTSFWSTEIPDRFCIFPVLCLSFFVPTKYQTLIANKKIGKWMVYLIPCSAFDSDRCKMKDCKAPITAISETSCPQTWLSHSAAKLQVVHPQIHSFNQRSSLKFWGCTSIE